MAGTEKLACGGVVVEDIGADGWQEDGAAGAGSGSPAGTTASAVEREGSRSGRRRWRHDAIWQEEVAVKEQEGFVSGEKRWTRSKR